MIRQLLDVVHQAVKAPLRVDFRLATQREAVQALVVPDVAKHRLDVPMRWPYRCRPLGESMVGFISSMAASVQPMSKVVGWTAMLNHGVTRDVMDGTHCSRLLAQLPTDYCRRILAIALPWASSSINLSK